MAATTAFWGLLGLALAAIALSMAVVFGAMGQAAVAAAVGLVASIQLAMLMATRRHAPPGTAREGLKVGEDAQTPTARHAGEADRMGRRAEPNIVGRGAAPAAVVGRPAGDALGEAQREAGETTAAGNDFLAQGELDLHLEPVVELSVGRTVYYRANLVLTRPDGSRLGSYLLSLSAERSGLAPSLDLALFQRVCPVIRHLKARHRRPGVFCPLSPQSFADRDVLEELVRFLRTNQDAAGGMVIDISQPGLAGLSPAGMEGLAYLAELGATLSLSEARLEGPDLATLVLLGFRFLDLDVAALAVAHGWDAFCDSGEVCRLARCADQAGLSVIAANVVRSEELDRVRPVARLARGSLFSPARLVRREITAPPAHAAAA